MPHGHPVLTEKPKLAQVVVSFRASAHAVLIVFGSSGSANQRGMPVRVALVARTILLQIAPTVWLRRRETIAFLNVLEEPLRHSNERAIVGHWCRRSLPSRAITAVFAR